MSRIIAPLTENTDGMNRKRKRDAGGVDSRGDGVKKRRLNPVNELCYFFFFF